MSTSAVSHWSVVDGLRMHALRWSPPTTSDAPPIVLVHGLGVSSRYMIPTADRLAARFTVWALDLPGFGQSAKPDHVYSLIELASVLERWLAGAGIEQPLLVGHSHGCQVIVKLLAPAPHLASGMLLAAPTVEAERRSIPGELVRLVRDIPRERPALIPVVFVAYLRAGLVRVFITLRGAIADRIEDKVATIPIPTIILRGERDPLVSSRWITLLAAKMRDARTLTIADGGHAVNFSVPDRFAPVVADLAERLAARR